MRFVGRRNRAVVVVRIDGLVGVVVLRDLHAVARRAVESRSARRGGFRAGTPGSVPAAKGAASSGLEPRHDLPRDAQRDRKIRAATVLPRARRTRSPCPRLCRPVRSPGARHCAIGAIESTFVPVRISAPGGLRERKLRLDRRLDRDESAVGLHDADVVGGDRGRPETVPSASAAFSTSCGKPCVRDASSVPGTTVPSGGPISAMPVTCRSFRPLAGSSSRHNS